METRGPQLIVLANREPYRHERTNDGTIAVQRSGSGVVNAVEPLLVACSGVWIAHGSGSADRDESPDRDGLDVPAESPAYRLRRVWLSEDEERGYYDGFANGALWPLCHRTYVAPVFRAEDFRAYRDVNARFARAACEEIGDATPVILVQDYHLALAPAMIRRTVPAASIATFWHIPWPHWETFAICPWRKEILRGLLGSSVLGFQTPQDCFKFIETVQHVLGAEADAVAGVISYQGRNVLVRDYATSIEWPGKWSQAASVRACRQSVRRDLRLDDDAVLAVSVDRFDYTKGIYEKLLIVERLLETYPGLRGRFAFAQLAEPTRDRLAAYRQTRVRVLETADRINREYSSDGYTPVIIMQAHHSQASMARFFRAADVCLVGSLHDGMNLVSKEFVAARDDEHGVLVLSLFTGAAAELKGAICINPYDRDGSAAALAAALSMPPELQRGRMRQMRRSVAANDAHTWAARLLRDVLTTLHPSAPAAVAARADLVGAIG